jgi:hypothetical protein
MGRRADFLGACTSFLHVILFSVRCMQSKSVLAALWLDAAVRGRECLLTAPNEGFCSLY